MSTQAALRRRTMQRSTGQKGKLGSTMVVWGLKDCLCPTCQLQPFSFTRCELHLLLCTVLLRS